MLWDKFKDYFHESWHESIRPFIESKQCDEIYAYLKAESRRGKKIAPLSSDTYRCFKETPLDKMKVVLLGMCPYHTQFNGVPVADGLLMGCSTTGKLQPSLEQFYNAVEKDCYKGLNLKYKKNPNVMYLADQGVLMFNAYKNTEWDSEGVFTKVNRILQDEKKTPIYWLDEDLPF